MELWNQALSGKSCLSYNMGIFGMYLNGLLVDRSKYLSITTTLGMLIVISIFPHNAFRTALLEC